MAKSTTTTANDIVYGAIITDRLLEELRPYNVSKPLFRWGAPGPSLVYNFPTLDDLGVGNATTEATDYSTQSEYTTSVAQCTSTGGAMRADVTDELVKTAIIDVIPSAAAALARSVAELFETDACALYDDFTNITTAASTMTADDFLAAMSGLEQRDVVGPLVSVLHPKQAGELRQDIAASSASIFSGGANTGGLVMDHLEGSVGSLFGVPIFQSSLVVSASSLRGGAMFVRNEALGAYGIWGPRVELQRDASERFTEIVVTEHVGVVEIADLRGQTIKSAA